MRSVFGCHYSDALLVRLARERRCATQQIQLAPARFHEMTAQVAVCRVSTERLPRLGNRLIDNLQVVLDDGDGVRVEPAPPFVHRTLEIGNGRVVLLVGEGDTCGLDVVVTADLTAFVPRRCSGRP